MSSPVDNLTNIISATPTAIAVLDTKMCYIAASQKWVDDYGLQEKEILGRSHYELFPEIGEEWKAIHADCLRGNVHKNEQDKFTRWDGTVQWLSWDVRPWMDNQGNIGGMIMYSEDITDRIVSNNELKRNLELYEETNKVARIGSWEIDLIQEIVFWSSMIKEIYELEPDFVPDKNSMVQFFKDGKNRESILRLMKEAIELGRAFNEVLEVLTAKGNSLWVRIRGNPQFKEGKCIRISGTIHDIQALKIKSIQLNDSKEKYKSIIDNSLNAHFLIEPDGHILEANKAALDMFGYTVDELRVLGRSGIMDTADPNLSKYLRDREKVGYAKAELIGIRKNAEHFPLEISSIMFKDSNGTQRTSVFMIDITDRRKTEESLRVSEEQFRNIFENIQDVFYQTNKEGMVTEISPSIKKHSGYERVEVIGRPVTDFYYNKDDGDRLTEILKEKQAVNDFEVRLRTKAGEFRYSSVNAQLIFRNSEVIGADGSMRDITERKFQEDSLKQLNSDLGLLNDQKNKLLSVIAHDLRNPISGSVALLEAVFMDIETTKKEELVEYMTMIQKSILNAHELLEDLLEWARIQFHTVDFNVTSVTDLRGQVKHCLNKLMHVAEAKLITISDDLEDGVKIRVDKYMLDSILRNLVTNAVKFTNKGGEVKVSAKRKGKAFLFSVEDNGIGIPEGNLGKLFSDETGFTSYGTSGEKGTGMGLGLCRNFVEKHGGKIWAESKEGEGSTFYFTIPDQKD